MNKPVANSITTDVGEDKKPGRWRQKAYRFFRFFLPGKVSRLHYYEARERYWSLKRIIQHELALIPEVERSTEEERSFRTLCLCEDILADDSKLLTRHQENINRLWRSLTRVTGLLINNVWSDKQLAAQLNMCREEAYRLRVEDDSTVSGFLQQIAELIDESGDLGDRKTRVRRTLVAAWERFNSIRTRRIHDQFALSKAYRKAVYSLMLISVLIIVNHQTITRDWNRSPEQTTQTEDPTSNSPTESSNPQDTDPASSEPVDAASSTIDLSDQPKRDDSIWGSFNKFLGANTLAFIYLGGLAGGLFSVVTRISRNELEPGADAYFTQYMLTKPFVGAFGAIVFFILFAGGVTELGIVPEGLNLNANGTVFGIAFLMGFSERLAFPEIAPT